jgi:hypothetical protein
MRFLAITCCAAMLAAVSGCAILGYVASSAPQKVKAQYAGLKGQSVAVMVWVDDGLFMDWGTRLQTDLAGAIQGRLTKASAANKLDEVKGITWPHAPAAIAVYQMENKHAIETMDIRDVAPRIQGITRLIYVEVEEFATRSYQAVELYRGAASASVKVVDIAADRSASIAYQESGIRVVFPPKTPPEGIPNADPYQIYLGTVASLAVEVANRFMEHEVMP